MLESNYARRATPIRIDERAMAGPVKVELQSATGRLVFRAKRAAIDGSTDIAGFPLDGPINSRRENDGNVSLRLGPDEWMFLCEDSETDTVVDTIGRTLGNTPHSLVDVSHRDVTFEVSGVEAAAVLNSGCPIDLELAAFPVGMATRTIFGKSDIVLARVSENTWRVTTWRSFGAYVQGYLNDAAQDFAAL